MLVTSFLDDAALYVKPSLVTLAGLIPPPGVTFSAIARVNLRLA